MVFKETISLIFDLLNLNVNVIHIVKPIHKTSEETFQFSSRIGGGKAKSCGEYKFKL